MLACIFQMEPLLAFPWTNTQSLHKGTIKLTAKEAATCSQGIIYLLKAGKKNGGHISTEIDSLMSADEIWR